MSTATCLYPSGGQQRACGYFLIKRDTRVKASRCYFRRTVVGVRRLLTPYRSSVRCSGGVSLEVVKIKGTIGDLPTLETERLILRKMTPDDAEAVFAYASDPQVTRYLIWDSHRTIEDSKNFLRSVVERYESAEAADWGIVYKGNGRFIVGCGIAGWHPDRARAEMGYVLCREYWGRGLMPKAVRAMIQFGFETMHLNRMEARCVTENVASARVMKKAGMTHEGTLRQREFIKEAYRDIELYAILKSEFSRR